jgi:hypothetical protein
MDNLLASAESYSPRLASITPEWLIEHDITRTPLTHEGYAAAPLLQALIADEKACECMRVSPAAIAAAASAATREIALTGSEKTIFAVIDEKLHSQNSTRPPAPRLLPEEGTSPLFERQRKGEPLTDLFKGNHGEFPNFDIPKPKWLYMDLRARLNALKVNHPERIESINATLEEMQLENSRNAPPSTGDNTHTLPPNGTHLNGVARTPKQSYRA